MPMFRFANVLLETNPRSVGYPALYCVSDRPVVHDEDIDEWTLRGPGAFDFSTYFNALSVQKLLKYTNAKRFRLHMELRGAACTVTQTKGDAFSSHPELIDEQSVSAPESSQWQSFELDLQVQPSWVVVGFVISAEGFVSIRNAYYEVEYEGDLRPVELVLSTTTFKKERFIERNIDLIKQNIVDSGEDIASHFNMLVVDNGRTLDVDKLSSEHITVVPNNNVGGAGGFTRGMITAMHQRPEATNVLLMDDDVAVSPESIKRTYNLLRLLNDSYSEAFISGAMLNFEIGDEQWEDLGFMTPKGTFAPLKPGLRLTKFEDVVFNEVFRSRSSVKGQMYAAWWYCCIPVSAIKKNGLPLPVFVRCDDAEYGVRCNPKFITMNGLCIWHMPFHMRYNPAVERYQTTRNTLIAQATTGFAKKSDFLYELHNNIRLELKKFGYDNAELCLDAFEDFLKGPGFISKPVAEECFMKANKRKEKLVPFDALAKQAEQAGLQDFNLSQIDRQLVDGDKPRNHFERLEDYLTNNGQRFFVGAGKGYAVIPVYGWSYPAGAIRGKHSLVVIDWWNRQGAIRTKDVKRYQNIIKRYRKDMAYYRSHIKQLNNEYADARKTMTSEAFWLDYLGMNNG